MKEQNLGALADAALVDLIHRTLPPTMREAADALTYAMREPRDSQRRLEAFARDRYPTLTDQELKGAIVATLNDLACMIEHLRKALAQ